jgi:hypothetical protein
MAAKVRNVATMPAEAKGAEVEGRVIDADAPSQAIVRAASVTREIVDSLGRTLRIKRHNTMSRMRLFKALGPELSDNRQYLSMAAIAAMVVAIDGDPIHPAANPMQIEALTQRLGDEGMDAVNAVAAEWLGLDPETGEPINSASQTVGDVKN